MPCVIGMAMKSDPTSGKHINSAGLALLDTHLPWTTEALSSRAGVPIAPRALDAEVEEYPNMM